MKIEMNLMSPKVAAIRAEALKSENERNVNFGANNVSMPETRKLSGAGITKVGGVSDINLARPVNFSRALSFTGNPSKNQKQIASIAPEYQDFFDVIYKEGGLGNVAGEASVAMKTHGGADIRTFIPYHTQDNLEGKLKIKRMIPGETFDTPNGKIPAYKFEAVDSNYQLKDDEEFVVHVKQEPGKPAAYKVIEDTGISGKVESIKPDLSGVDETPYRMFKAKAAGKKEDQDVYLMYLPDTARFPKVYGKGLEDLIKEKEEEAKKAAAAGEEVKKDGVNVEGYGATTGSGAGNYADGRAVFADIAYANFDRAVMDALPKMNNEKFGNYNPASFWLHDRHAFPSAKQMFEESHSDENSYWNGIRAHSTFHNPGRGYQGVYRNPFDFLRIVGTKADLEELQERPVWKNILEANKTIEDAKEAAREKQTELWKAKASPEEIQKAGFDINNNPAIDEKGLKKIDDMLQPILGEYVDSLGTYNMCKIPVVFTKADPDMFSAGTVSKYYGKEMRDPQTEEIAYGLTKDFMSIEKYMVDVVNGSTPANVNLNQVGILAPNPTFVNGFTTEINNGFKPYPELVKDAQGAVQNIDAVYDVKQSNKEWFINTVAKATKEGNQALLDLFYDKKQVAQGATVLGGLSEFKEGDQLFISWGRPDKQKGFPTTMESFYQYFSNPDISDDMKSKTKVLMSAGPWPTKEKDPELNKEWEAVQQTLKQIQELDGGKYKDNIVFVNGFFSNRIGMFSDWGVVTSEYEPCGITPLEAFATGTPVLSNRTGGSPDFIEPYNGSNAETSTGFLTKTAYKVNPEVIGAAVGTMGEYLEQARRKSLGGQNAENIKQAMELSINKPEDYKKMARNAISLKIDWHENNAFNGGKSAIQRYFQDAWHITI